MKCHSGAAISPRQRMSAQQRTLCLQKILMPQYFFIFSFIQEKSAIPDQLSHGPGPDEELAHRLDYTELTKAGGQRMKWKKLLSAVPLFTRGCHNRQLCVFNLAIFTLESFPDATPSGSESLRQNKQISHLLGKRVNHYTTKPLAEVQLSDSRLPGEI